MKVFTPQQMRAFDAAASAEYAIPSIVLMENAALRVVEFLEAKFAPLSQQKVVILCGKGNNGGDGLAIARHLAGVVSELKVFLACDEADFKGDAAINCLALRTAIGQEPGLAAILPLSERGNFQPDIVLDALLGTGFRGEISDERLLSALQFFNENRAIKISIDVPSGLNTESGEASAYAARADYTITFAAPKRGMFLRKGIEHSGEIWVGGIGTSPLQMEATHTDCKALTRHSASQLLPHRPIDAHKGTAGKVLICGGSRGMSGAPTLAASAALKIGAGLCTAAVPDKVLDTFAASILEATSHPLACDDEGRLIESAADALAKLWQGVDVVALGPGLSRSQGALDFARRVVRECPLPLIVDADALYALRAIETEVRARTAPTILTPHPGEMGELMHTTAAEVNDDRIAIAQACAAQYNAIVVLKGARSIIARPDGKLYINLTGNPGMATGGSGDVLTGTIAGLLAQTKDARNATLLGVYLHGLAGDIAYSTKGTGLIASDIADCLPAALLDLEHRPEPEAVNAHLQKLE